MIFRTLLESDFEQILSIWNEDVVPHTIYKALTLNELKDKIMNEHYDYKGTVVVLNHDLIIGFGIAYKTTYDVKIPGFIGALFVKNNYQRQGIGKQILNHLENYLKSVHKTFVRQYFASPLNFEWVIPHTNHYHTGAPAIPYNTPIYYFLQNNGYEISGQLDGYHLDLKHFTISNHVLDMIEDNKKDQYIVERYNPLVHKGLVHFFERIKNPSWQKIALENEAKEKPDPMLVITKDHIVLGWTGPLSVTHDKKGSFGGIGVDPNVRNRKLGTILFVMLCKELKDMGATYMTLFTGADNVARRIYIYAGFKIVHSFSILKKEL